ncbi:hypothetical protein FSW04_05545 [Baekduia soli]|uniref:Uncharacterized protein n=1 Tax=Baekduia soli TaxID=496014 RepID=A0A5B8U2L4_9ACTN|nr:hypothetical protein [Baekduia soli]QEC47105.1 hypothetical protein FSW04_05545 [Baekduia soli]
MLRAPDIAAPVVGFRAWRILGDRLMSPYIPCRWEGRVLHAACYDANRVLQRGRGWLSAPHDSPHPDCQCGIYAYHRPGTQGYYGEWLWTEGVLSAWGRVEVHADGLRAEHGRIEALALPPRNDPERREAVGRVARRLGVPTVARDELEAVRARLGGGLPATLIPDGAAQAAARSVQNPS